MTQPDAALTTAWLEDFASRWFETWNNHDPDGVVDLCHPAIEWDEVGARRVVQGRAAARERLVETFVAFPDASFDRIALYVGSGTPSAALWWRMSATLLGPLHPPGFAPTGRRVEYDGADFWQFEDGLLRSLRLIYDVNGIAAQAGLAPIPGSRAERAIVAGQRLTALVRERLRRRGTKPAS
jgi:predicted ester cyclase